MIVLLRSLLLLTLIPGALATEAPRGALIVFAAASLTDTLHQIGDAYAQTSGVPVKLSFAATSALARQIEAGARADVFLSADQEWMDYLEQRRLIDSGSRTDLVGNRLALIAPHDSTLRIDQLSGRSLLAALGRKGRLATGDPDSVPAGKYAQAALTSLDLWRQLAPRLARTENVRVALSYVARGEAPLGIVYATDALAEPRVRTVTLFPESSHPPITYPVAKTATAQTEADSFLSFLRSPEAQSLFASAGFTTLSAASGREENRQD